MTATFTATSYAIDRNGRITTGTVAADPVCVIKPLLSPDKLSLRGFKYQWEGEQERIMSITKPLHEEWKSVYNCGISDNSDFYALSYYLKERLGTQVFVDFIKQHLDPQLSIQDSMLALLCISRVVWLQLLKQLKAIKGDTKSLPEMSYYHCDHQHARRLLLPMMASGCGRLAPSPHVIDTICKYHALIADLYQGTHDLQQVTQQHSQMCQYLWG